MPTISMFYGIFIQMFFRDHAPPHFHAKYGEYKVVINIRSLDVMEGSLPRRALGLVLDWAKQHQGELLNDWDLCQNMEQPVPIAPLE